MNNNFYHHLSITKIYFIIILIVIPLTFLLLVPQNSLMNITINFNKRICLQDLNNSKHQDRELWLNFLINLSYPILKNLANQNLKKTMQIEVSPYYGRTKDIAYTEAFCRLLCGIAPWLELESEESDYENFHKTELRNLAKLSLINAINSSSPDYLLWYDKNLDQPLCDCAYLAQAFLRAPKTLWYSLDNSTQQSYIEAFRKLRTVRGVLNNWVLFRAVIEVFMLYIDEEYDKYALNLAINTMNKWYAGNGFYKDGDYFRFDYYNSFAIHPMLVEVLEITKKKNMYFSISFEEALRRMNEYNLCIERLISPEGTFPVIGRSIIYRMGAFQTLSLSAWKYKLPESLPYGQIRYALTTVLKNMFGDKTNFNDAGFLILGFMGHQPNVANYYSNSGSLYITSLFLMPLGLPSSHSFWTDDPVEWTSLRAWKGKEFPIIN